MNISCDCGSFKAKLLAFPKNTPGHLACYCRDCQAYLNRIDRADVLDAYGGTEIIPAYPSELKILQGKALLQNYKLTEKGLHRWATTCCNSPMVNAKPGFPWLGIYHTAYKNTDPSALDRLGGIKSRIFGRDAIGEAPFNISEKITFKDMMVVLPFIIKGKITNKSRGSEFYHADNTPIVEPIILRSPQ